jgi:hypothetical protein
VRLRKSGATGKPAASIEIEDLNAENDRRQSAFDGA